MVSGGGSEHVGGDTGERNLKETAMAGICVSHGGMGKSGIKGGGGSKLLGTAILHARVLKLLLLAKGGLSCGTGACSDGV